MICQINKRLLVCLPVHQFDPRFVSLSPSLSVCLHNPVQQYLYLYLPECVCVCVSVANEALTVPKVNQSESGI